MKPDRFEVFASVMIAIVSILSALTAWRANSASNEAGQADFDGISASIRAQEARIFNAIRAFEHYRAFTDYYRYNALGNQITDDAAFAAARERTEFWGLALGLQYTFFPSQYLDQEGNYDVQREIDELWAESNAFVDLNPSQHYSRADAYRAKVSNLTGSLILFAAAFFFFAVAQAIRNVLKYFFAMAGLAATLGGLCAVLVLEFAL